MNEWMNEWMANEWSTHNYSQFFYCVSSEQPSSIQVSKNDWINEWINQQINDWMIEWMHEWMNVEWVNNIQYPYTNSRQSVRIN